MFIFGQPQLVSLAVKDQQGLEPQISSSVIQHLQLPLSEYAVDVVQLFRECGISQSVLDSPHGQLPLSRYLMFLHRATLQAGEPLLSIKLAKSIGVELLGALGFLFLTSRTIYDALSTVSFYQNLLQESTAITFVQDGDYFVFGYEVYGMGDVGVREDVEFSLAFTSQIIRMYCNNQIKPERITFRHSPSTNISKYQELLSVCCHFEQEHNQIYLRKEDVGIQGLRHDPNLTKILKNYLDADLSDRNQRHRFADQVKQTILSLQNNQTLTAAVVANVLGVSKSTFDRRLKQEGTSYKRLHDEIQFELACQYLKNSQLNILQVSQLLGFSSAASFTRAFIKWSDGQTPKSCRRSAQ